MGFLINTEVCENCLGDTDQTSAYISFGIKHDYSMA